MIKMTFYPAGKRNSDSPVKRRTSCVLGFFLSLLMLLVNTNSTKAQQQIEILEADRIEGGTVEGKKVQKILENVHLKTEELEVFCDSAYQFVNESEVRAYGNIQINTEGEKIWSDSLVYFTDIDFSQLRGRVVIETDSTILFGNSVDYRFSTKVAHFLDKVRLEDQRGTLLANSGFYYREPDSAVFRGQVQLADTLQYLEGDSLFSNRSESYYEIHSNVFADDRENNTMLKSDYLEADSAGNRLLEGNAWLKTYESDTTDTSVTAGTDTTGTAGTDTTGTASADTTHIRAQIIHSERHQTDEDTVDIVNAYHEVRIWSPNFAAVGDTARYDDQTGHFELWSNPIAWHKQVQLTGPYIKAKLVEGDIDSLESYPRPFSVQEDTTIDRLNQITGDTLKADFREGELRQIHIYENANLLRFMKNDEGNPDGAVEMTAPHIYILFRDGEIDTLKAIGAVNGSSFQESEQTAERTLDGFVWNPERRPTEPKEKMEPRLPPIAEDPFFELPRRYRQYLEQKKKL